MFFAYSGKIFCALICATSLVYAQKQLQHTNIRAGITGSAVLNMHSGDFSTVDGLQECGTFSDATSLQWQVGNAAWFPINDQLSIVPRLSYWKADGTFNNPNPAQPFVAMPDGSLARLNTEYELETTVDYVLVDVMAQYYITPQFYVGAGPQLGFNTRALFEQQEKIISPSIIEFRNGGTERTFFSGSFSNNEVSTNLRVALQAVAGYDIPLGTNFIITPEVGYAFPFTSVTSTGNWNISAVRAGISLMYAFIPAEAPPVPEPSAAPEPKTEIVVAKPAPSAELTIESVMPDATIVPGAELVITELRKNDAVPMLPYVFFDQNTATIPTRYKGFSGSQFNEQTLQDSVLGIYHHLLNVVGSRMQKYPEATLNIRGHREITDETNGQLSVERAKAVADYLTQNWGISASRLTISSGDLPPVVSNRGVDDGRNENRRVELSTSDARILAPVQRTEVQRIMEPKAVVMNAQLTNSERYSSVSLGVFDDNGTQRYSTAPGVQNAVSATFNPDPAAVASWLGARNSMRGTIRFTGNVDDGQVVTREQSMPVRRKIQSTRFNNEVVKDSTIEQFRLIFFDFDAPTVSSFNTSMIDLVRSRMRTTSAVRVIGLTDRIGTPEYNTQLSLKRAQAMNKAIQERIVPAASHVTGDGPRLIYNNDLPEGRFYNRTVLIEVATPVDE